ncbi:MAG: efflux RND transporter periplasmic adaptor subunit [Gammaproteobacteria bacterium]
MTSPSKEQQKSLADLLGQQSASSRRAKTRWIVAAALILLAVGAYFFLRPDSGTAALRYQTEPVVRGNLTVTVSATGTLQPINQVDVGSELSGIVEAVLVDDNDQVTKGQVLARLDTSKLEDQVAKSRAAVVAAEAQVQQMQATVEEARANLTRLRQVAELSGGKVPSKAELETAEAVLKRAIANEAAAQAAVIQAKATLQSDETNLSKAYIRSPIDGVVLLRQVEPGQTVAASLQAPVLLTLAEDLAQMELRVDVDEADVGRVREGQSATFTVDAYPDRKYPASIKRVSYGSQIKDNVVSYPTLLQVDNSDLSLRPGMTATAEIVTAQRENVLLVPSAALRYSPPPSNANQGPGFVGSLMPRPPMRRMAARPAGGGNGEGRRVWILRDGQPVPVTVVTGASDGRYTEIVSGELQEGMAVITDSSGAP